jgi:hypothetical protein
MAERLPGAASGGELRACFRPGQTATPETVHAGKRPIEVVRVRITDAGRLALAG